MSPCRVNKQFKSLQTHLAQNKLHITELTILKQFAIVFMESTLWVAGELREEKIKVKTSKKA